MSTPAARAELPTLYYHEQPTIAHPAARVVSPAAGVAENGSYYGQLNNNGVPKTVSVQGYYRHDGTYVRGHYRSAPGSN